MFALCDFNERHTPPFTVGVMCNPNWASRQGPNVRAGDAPMGLSRGMTADTKGENAHLVWGNLLLTAPSVPTLPGSAGLTWQLEIEHLGSIITYQGLDALGDFAMDCV